MLRLPSCRLYRVTRARNINYDFDNERRAYKKQVAEMRKQHWADYWST